MTDRAINLAIAEVCGWKRPAMSFGLDLMPDYCNDLNAIHEAEKLFDTMHMDEQSKYLDYLYCEVGWDDANNAQHARHKCYYGSVRATARQRAEAFLRTKGLWKETPCAKVEQA